MFSPMKNEDKQLLLEISEMIQELSKRIEHPQVLELLKKFGEDYERLEEKIKTYDYSKEDEAFKRADKRIEDYYKNRKI